MESHTEITNKDGVPSSPEGATTDAPRKPRKPRARSEIVTSTSNESRKDEPKPKKEKKEKKEKKVKKDKLDTEGKKSKKEKKDKKSKKETSESNTTTDNEADSFSAIVLPPSYQWPSRKIQSLPHNQTGIKERPSLRNLDPMFLASPKLDSKEWVESLLVNKAVPSVVPSPDAKKSEFSDSTLQRAANAKAYFEEKYKKIATTLNTGNVYNPIEDKRKQIANQRAIRSLNRFSADDARIRKGRDEAIRLREEEEAADKMIRLRMEEEAERKFQEEQREKQLKLMQEENEMTHESGTSPDNPSGKVKFLSIFDTNPIDRLGQKLSSLETSRIGQKLSSIDGSKIHQKLKGMKNQVFKTNKKRENEIVTSSTPPSPHDAINMNVVDALLQDLEGHDTLITSEERDLLDALANTTTRPHSSSISQSGKIQVGPQVVLQDIQSASAENVRATLEPKVPAVQSLPSVLKLTEDMNDPEIDTEIDKIEEKIAERERLLQEIHNKFPHFEEMHSFAEEMTSSLAESKKELSETISSVRMMDNDLITTKNTIDISLSTIQKCSDRIQRLEEGIQDCQRIKGNIMFTYISSILSVYFLSAFSILAKIAYYPYHEVSKRLTPQQKTTKPKDSSIDSISADSAPISPEASVTSQKKKGLLNRKDNWEALQTKMLDVQRLREEEKKKQNL